MDWMTLTILIVCGAIFVSFVVIPIGEFREIFHAIKHRSDVNADASHQADPKESTR